MNYQNFCLILYRYVLTLTYRYVYRYVYGKVYGKVYRKQWNN